MSEFNFLKIFTEINSETKERESIFNLARYDRRDEFECAVGACPMVECPR